MKKGHLVAILTFLLCIQWGYGQHYHFKQYSLEDGLPQSEIYGMAEDQFGYLWVGTNGGGLCRFNGQGFEVITRKNGLINNIILGLHHDDNFNLWIGAPNGIQKYDGKKFTTIFQTDSAVFGDKIFFEELGPNNLWCLSQLITGKRNLYKIENDSLIDYTQKFSKELGKDNYILNILPDKNSNLLIATLKNVYRLSEGQLEIVDADYLNLDSTSIRYPLLIDRNNRMWCMIYDESKGIRLIVHNFKGDVKEVDLPEKIKGKEIFYGFEDRSGDLWFLVNDGGVLNRSKNGWRIFDKSNGLPINMVFSFHQDAEGNIWMGTLGGGLVRYSGELFVSLDRNSGLTDDVVRGIYQDKEGKYYFTDSDGGFSTLKDGFVKEYVTGSITDFGAINAFHELPNGNLLVCARKGLFEYNGKSATKVNKKYGWADDIAIKDMAQIGDTLFFGTIRYGLIKSYRGQATFYNSYNSNLLDNIITHLLVDSQERLWVSSARGITLYQNGVLTKFDEGNALLSSYVLQAAEDRVGNIWFASYTKGLICYDGSNWTTFDSSNGLSSDNIYSIIADGKGNIWAGAQNGVDKIEIAENGEVTSVESFDRYDGFVGMENNSSSNLRDKDGKLWFGTVKGVMSYNPEERRINYLPPPVYIRDIELSYVKPDWSDEKYTSSYDSIVPWFNVPNELVLPKEQNNISFKFDALCYTVPEKVKYKWRLEPIESQWVIGTNNEVAYPSLPPGDYTFRVTASNNDGVWNDDGASYFFSIHPAWYQTLAFKAFILAFVIGLLILLVYLWNTRLKTLRFEMETLVVAKTKEIRSQKKEIEAKNNELKEQKEQITRQANSIAAAYNDLEQLTEIGKTLSVNLSANRIFNLVYKATSEIMDTYLFGIGLYNQETNTLDFQNAMLEGELMPFITFTLDDTERLPIHCLLNDKEIYIRDFDKDYTNYINEIRPAPGDINSQSMIYVPLKVSSGPFGVLTVQSAEKNAFSKYHLNFIRNIGIYTSIALENAKAFQQMKDHQNELENAKQIAVDQKELVQQQRDDLDRLFDENNQLIRLFTTELEKPILSSLAIANDVQRKDNASVDDMNEAISKLMESLWQIKDMLNQVGEIKRIEKEDFQINSSNVSIVSLLKEVVAQYNENLQSKNVSIVWDVKDLIIRSDYSILEKIFLNLLSNAIKFTEPNTKVTVSCFGKEDGITVGIRDEGPGMSEEVKEKLFTKYTNVGANENNIVSSGLGLYIVKKYVDSLKGTITCTSHVNIGTTFFVNLPK